MLTQFDDLADVMNIVSCEGKEDLGPRFGSVAGRRSHQVSLAHLLNFTDAQGVDLLEMGNGSKPVSIIGSWDGWPIVVDRNFPTLQATEDDVFPASDMMNNTPDRGCFCLGRSSRLLCG